MRSINPEMEEGRAHPRRPAACPSAIRKVLGRPAAQALARGPPGILVFIPATREIVIRDLPGRPETRGSFSVMLFRPFGGG